MTTKTTSYEIPSTCKAGCVVNPGANFSVEVTQVPVPSPDPDSLLVRLTNTGICHSDISYMSAMGTVMKRRGVRSPGHEGVGVVVQVGSNVTDWKVGDRVGIKPIFNVCRKCEPCLSGREMHCEKVVPTGLAVPGSYQHYITVPAGYTPRIPDGVDDFTAATIMCSGTTAHKGWASAGLKAGEWAVVTGAGGGVGHFLIQLLALSGLRIIAVDSGAAKKALCEKLGCKVFIDYAEVGSVDEEVFKFIGGKGAHAVFVAAGSSLAYQSAPKMLRPGGKIICLGHPPASDPPSLDPNQLIFKNLQVTGSMIGTLRDTQKALDFASRGELQCEYESFSIDDLPKALEKLHHGQVAGRCVVTFDS